MNNEKNEIISIIINKKINRQNLTEAEELIASKYFTEDELKCINIFEMKLSNCTCKKKPNIENFEKLSLNLNR